MLKWIADYIDYVEKRPQDFNKDVKCNIRQIKELISRKNIVYKESDPIAFEKFCRLFKHREGVLAGKPLILNMEQRYIIKRGLEITWEAELMRHFTCQFKRLK